MPACTTGEEEIGAPVQYDHARASSLAEALTAAPLRLISPWNMDQSPCTAGPRAGADTVRVLPAGVHASVIDVFLASFGSGVLVAHALSRLIHTISKRAK